MGDGSLRLSPNEPTVAESDSPVLGLKSTMTTLGRRIGEEMVSQRRTHHQCRPFRRLNGQSRMNDPLYWVSYRIITVRRPRSILAHEPELPWATRGRKLEREPMRRRRRRWRNSRIRINHSSNDSISVLVGYRLLHSLLRDLELLDRGPGRQRGSLLVSLSSEGMVGMEHLVIRIKTAEMPVRTTRAKRPMVLPGPVLAQEADRM